MMNIVSDENIKSNITVNTNEYNNYLLLIVKAISFVNDLNLHIKFLLSSLIIEH